MKMMKKSLLLLLSLAIALLLTPTCGWFNAYAASGGSTIDMSDPAPPSTGDGWEYNGDRYLILDGAVVTVTGDNRPASGQTRRRIDVASGAVAMDATQKSYTVTVTVQDIENICEVYDEMGNFVGTYSFADAMAAAGVGYTVLLVEDVTESLPITIDAGMDFTIDTDGRNLTLEDNLTVTNAGALCVNGDIQTTGDAELGVTNGGHLTVNGDVTALSATDIWGSLVQGSGTDSSVVVTGSLTTDCTGVIAESGATVNIGGSVRAGIDGVVACDSGTSVIVTGDIHTGSYGIIAWDETVVTVNGYIRAEDGGISADNGAAVTVGGSVAASADGVYASGMNTIVTVTGDIDAGQGGVYAEDGASVAASGDVIATNLDPNGIGFAVYCADSSIDIAGGVETTGNGVYAVAGVIKVGADINTGGQALIAVDAAVLFGGNVFANGIVLAGTLGPERAFSIVSVGGAVEIAGNVETTGGGIYVFTMPPAIPVGAKVTVNGVLTATGVLILINGSTYAPDDFAEPTTKTNYLTYTDGESTIWVHISLKDVTEFMILGVSGAITEGSPNTITLTVPSSANLSNLTPTVTHTGASISPASGTAQDFSEPVTYTVTAANGTTKEYVVTVAKRSGGGSGSGGVDNPAPEPKAEEPSGGAPANAPEGQEPADKNNGATTFPDGGAVTAGNGSTITVPPGTTISEDGVIHFPPGSGGGKITDKYGNTFMTPADAVLTLDGTTQPGYHISVANPFADAGENDWFHDAVIFVYARGLMAGTGADLMEFSPNAATTRGMIVTVLYRLAGSPDVSGLANPFDDVAAGAWYADAARWAAARGIVVGTGDGNYNPNALLTRQDLTVILDRYAAYMGITLPETRPYPGFNDAATIANYAQAAVERFYAAEIIGGYPDNSFKPQEEATRAEFAAMLTRFLQAAQ